MPIGETRTIELTPELAASIDGQLAAGAYETAGEVIAAEIELLRDSDEAITGWLMRDVTPVYDAMMDDRSRGIPAERVFAGLRDRHAKRLRDTQYNASP